jgi:hypothetical protein
MKKEKSISFLYVLIFLSCFIFHDLPLLSQDLNSDSLSNAWSQEFHKIVNHDKLNAQRWWYGWLAGYSAATAGQGIFYFSSDVKATRQDMVLGSATTLLGAIGVLVMPIVPRKSSLQNPEIHANDSCQEYFDTANSEKLLKEIALKEKEGRSWKIHAITGAANIGSGLITWLGFKRTFKDGLFNFALNTVITETQIWTQPVKAIKDYQKYCNYNTASSVPPNLKPEKRILLCSHPAGFALKLDF